MPDNPQEIIREAAEQLECLANLTHLLGEDECDSFGQLALDLRSLLDDGRVLVALSREEWERLLDAADARFEQYGRDLPESYAFIRKQLGKAHD